MLSAQGKDHRGRCFGKTLVLFSPDFVDYFESDYFEAEKERKTTSKYIFCRLTTAKIYPPERFRLNLRRNLSASSRCFSRAPAGDMPKTLLTKTDSFSGFLWRCRRHSTLSMFPYCVCHWPYSVSLIIPGLSYSRPLSQEDEIQHDRKTAHECTAANQSPKKQIHTLRPGGYNINSRWV